MFGFESEADAMAAPAPFAGLPDHAHVIDRLEAGLSVDRVESVLRRPDGRPFRALTSAAFTPGEDGRPATIDRLIVDIDDRARLEEQLRLARRLEAAGRLAAEMSPEIDPVLAAIEDPQAPPSDRRRAAMLVRQLLAFSRHQAKPAGMLSLYDAVRRAEPMLRQIAGDLAPLELRIEDAGTIAASEDDVEQLLAALVFAAAGTLPYGGTITISTRAIRTGFDQWTELAVGAGGYGVHSVSISSSLARLVTKCGGTVHVTDDPARATTLHVHLPC
jgi:signal transduction histidine kinase